MGRTRAQKASTEAALQSAARKCDERRTALAAEVEERQREQRAVEALELELSTIEGVESFMLEIAGLIDAPNGKKYVAAFERLEARLEQHKRIQATVERARRLLEKNGDRRRPRHDQDLPTWRQRTALGNLGFGRAGEREDMRPAGIDTIDHMVERGWLHTLPRRPGQPKKWKMTAEGQTALNDSLEEAAAKLGQLDTRKIMGSNEDGPRTWPDNLEAQSAVVAAILRHLMRGGITRADLSVDPFLPDIRAAGYPEPVDSDGLFLDLMVWLQDEGVIRIGAIADDGRGGNFFTDCVITGHGMQLLRQKADVLGGQSAADVIMAPKIDGMAPASQQVKLGALIGGIFGGFTKSIS